VDETVLGTILLSAPARRIFEIQCVIDYGQEEGTQEQAPPGPIAGVVLPELSLKAAKQVIATCTDVAQLRKWAMEDARAPVRKALHLRYRELMPADAPAMAIE
jgi:hypothetical protein